MAATLRYHPTVTVTAHDFRIGAREFPHVTPMSLRLLRNTEEVANT